MPVVMNERNNKKEVMTKKNIRPVSQEEFDKAIKSLLNSPPRKRNKKDR
jgi:hypothetical protein